MFRQIFDCMFVPIKIGAYMKKPIYKTLLIHLLLGLIVIIPVFAFSFKDKNLNFESYKAAEENLMKVDTELSFHFKDNVLEVPKEFYYSGYEANILFYGDKAINNTTLKSNIYETPSVLFLYDHVEIKFLTFTIYSETYANLHIEEIDSTKINNYDYKELDKLFDLYAKIYNANYVKKTAFYLVLDYFNYFFTVIAVGLLMGIVSFFSRPFVPFKVRLKMSLDALMVLAVVDLITNLIGISWIHYGGIILAYVYLLISFKAIVQIRVNNGPTNPNNN